MSTLGMSRTKARIRFRKAGDLRFFSHHDLLRGFERMLRRSGLPFKSTEGFHPKARIVFASALGLGTVGHREVVEIEFEGELSAETIRAALEPQRFSTLDFLDIKLINPRLTGLATLARYEIHFDSDAPLHLDARIAELLAREDCWIERLRGGELTRRDSEDDDDAGEEGKPVHYARPTDRRPEGKKVNIRPYLRSLRRTPIGFEFEIIITPTGSARPDEVVRALGLGTLLEGGAVLHRTELLLADELEALESTSTPVTMEQVAAQPLSP